MPPMRFIDNLVVAYFIGPSYIQSGPEK